MGVIEVLGVGRYAVNERCGLHIDNDSCTEYCRIALASNKRFDGLKGNIRSGLGVTADGASRPIVDAFDSQVNCGSGDVAELKTQSPYSQSFGSHLEIQGG